ncbi:ArnT family glycosyltransferase [Flectobacillus longus]|uniref:ArnT family glycosyltransferase n=1 Tax=Flectobacillus longus TaxID=2984207 RepID=UPI0024B68A01|nr:glycosyltransferase family 39 protein [Flectobacillus longus]MDI9882537.1 glycosyltransferase family 39 protein [Flectobacillus longus]
MLNKHTTLSKSIITFSSLIFIFLGLYKLQYFGLEYDETLFINAALGDLDGETFVSYKIKDWVILCYLYIGALKAWIYIPIFKVFGVSTLSVRLPMLFLACVNLWLSYKITAKYFNNSIALATLLILSVDLTFLTLQRFDKGPSCIELFIKLLILQWLTYPNKHWFRYGLVIFFLMFVGVYNKFNFIWFTNAVFGVYVLQQAPSMVLIFKKSDFKGLLQSNLFRYGLGYMAFVFLFLFTLKQLHIDGQGEGLTLVALKQRLSFCLKETKYLLLQNSIFKVFGWSIAGVLSSTLMNVVILSCLLTNCWLYLKRRIAFHSSHTQGLLLILLIFLQYIITPAATHVWHSFVMYPMLPIIVLSSFYELGKYLGGLVPFVGVAMVGVGWNIFTNILFFQNIHNQSCVTEIFIPEINEVISYVTKDKNRLVISTDWGTHTQLLGIDNKRNKFSEPYRLFPYPSELSKWWVKNQDFFNADKPVIIVQAIATDIAKKTRYDYNVTMEEKKSDAFIHYLEQKGVKIWPTKLIKNSCGDRLFQIYEAQISHKN